MIFGGELYLVSDVGGNGSSRAKAPFLFQEMSF